MGYTAIEKMRDLNRERFGRDVGPFSPLPVGRERTGMDLKSAALRFLAERCEGLRFDPETEKREANGKWQGTSFAPEQIPYNMQMDVDRICLKNELAAFIDSGAAEDAYTVYYAYLEMFMGKNGRSRSMVEMLSEYESNASSLLMSHRDHYSHSVYVFALGLAIYETNAGFRKIFSRAYGFRDRGEGHESACAFLRFWGMTALFHDIGYPFEIPFEQVMAYFEVENRKRGPENMYLAYRNIEPFVRIGGEDGEKLKELYGREFSDLIELLAFGIAARMGEAYGITEGKMDRVIRNKPTHPEENNYFMDHAFFSAGRLYREIVRILGGENLSREHVDVLTAIMLHNSLFKFAILGYKSDNLKAPLKAELHPLAWMLMLCDELQCWDRTAYGRNSRTELHPMGVDFDFTGGGIRAVYFYDIEMKERIRNYTKQYKAWEAGGKAGKPPRLKAYSDMAGTEQRFREDIGQIADLTGMPLTVDCALRKADRRMKHTYLSESSFLHIYDFAVVLHARYSYSGRGRKPEPEKMEEEFNRLSLEYKISNMNQAKSFDRNLNAIECFFTDKPVDFEMLKAFTQEMVAVFAPMEHERWVREHQAMGWTAGNDYETLPVREKGEAEKAERIKLREQLRMHKLTLPAGTTGKGIRNHYNTLSPEDQGKDYLPFNSMLKLMEQYDGVRIYRMRSDGRPMDRLQKVLDEYDGGAF